MSFLSRHAVNFRRESSALSRGERLCDWMVVGLAGWTVACNAIVALGAGLQSLLYAALGMLGLAAAAWIGLRRWGADVDTRSTADDPSPTPAPGLATRVRVGGALASLGVVTAAVFGLDYRVAWSLAVAILLVALAQLWRPAAPIAPERRASWERATGWLAALGALFPLFAQRRSLDDAYYVNVAVAAVDSPARALLRFDTLHGIPDLPIMFPVYKVNSYELLAAAVSYLSPLTAIQAAHWVLPAVFGGFVVLAHARLLRWLAPEFWLPALIATLAILLTVAETTSFYSNFAFVRLHQGKCVFLSVLIPLLIVYGVRFAQRPSVRGWLLLACAQVASLGLTSSAIWLAPVVAALSLAACLPVNRSGIRLLGVGLVASIYPLGAGLLVRAAQLGSMDSGKIPKDVEPLLRAGSAEMLGEGPIAALSWVALLSAWCFARNPLASRICVVFSLGFLAVLYNPLVATTFASWVTGPGTHYRTFWLLPIPVFLAMIATAPLAWRAAWASPALRFATCLVSVLAFLSLAPSLYLLSSENHVRFNPFGLKVPPREYALARVIAERAPPRSWVLAPEEVSTWVVTFHQHPYPLMPRRLYLELTKEKITPAERDLRWALTEYIAGARLFEDASSILRAAVDHYEFGAVGVTHSAWSDAIARVLSAKGYREDYSDDVYAVWLSAEAGR